MSRRPNSATARSTAVFARAASAPSPVIEIAFTPVAVNSPRTALSVSSLRSTSTRLAPASAKALAVAAPMPEPAPVTSATWPLKS